MKILLSPSKKLDFDSPTKGDFTDAEFLKESRQLIKELRGLSLEDISALMGLSHKLTELNFERYKKFSTPFTLKNAKQAGYAFKGDVYDGLKFEDLSDSQVKFAQGNLRILSGLYGILRPLDLIQPYRLEMGTKLKNSRGKNLYEFWGESLTKKLNDEEKELVINLASNEYFKAIKPKSLNAKVVTPVFKEYKNGKFKIIMLFAKRARGMMANYIIRNGIEDTESLKDFNDDGYLFNAEMSGDGELVFVR